MSAETPTPSIQEATQAPVNSGENVLLSSPVLRLSEGIVKSRRSNVRRAGAFAGAVLAVATLGSSLNIGGRANAQGPDYVPPSPAASSEPIPSVDPNGETAQGEVPCEPEVIPAALFDPAPSVIPSTAPESFAPLPSGGDLIGGDLGGENCTVAPEKMHAALNEILDQNDKDINKNVKPKQIKKKFNLLWNGQEKTNKETGEKIIIPGIKDKIAGYVVPRFEDQSLYEYLSNNIGVALDPKTDKYRRTGYGSDTIGILSSAGFYLSEEEYARVIEFIDPFYDYVVTHTDPGNEVVVKELMKEASVKSLDFFLSKLIPQ